MRKLVIPSILFLAVIFLADSVSAQTVSGYISKGRVTKGTTARGVIVLKIPKGLHVNSYRPRSEYAIPTRVSVSAVGARAFGVTYPPGKMKSFSFSDVPISIYDGRAVFGFKLRVPKGYRGRWVTVKARVRYQACTDEVCYRPTTKTINIRARVR